MLVDRVTGEGRHDPRRGQPHAEAISADGRYVLFGDDVEDLENPAGAHETGIETVYVRDMQAGTTTAVSRANGPTGAIANEESQAYSISPDGRYVPFESSATNLVPRNGIQYLRRSTCATCRPTRRRSSARPQRRSR